MIGDDGFGTTEHAMRELQAENAALRARVVRLEEFVKKAELAFDEIGAVNWSRRARRALEEK